MSEMWTRCSFALNRSLKLIYFTFFECLLCVSRLAFRNVLPWFLRLPVGKTFIQWIYSSISFSFCPPFGFSPKIWHSLQLFCQIYGPSLLSRQNHSALVTDVSYGRDIRFACGCSGFKPRFAFVTVSVPNSTQPRFANSQLLNTYQLGWKFSVCHNNIHTRDK